MRMSPILILLAVGLAAGCSSRTTPSPELASAGRKNGCDIFATVSMGQTPKLELIDGKTVSLRLDDLVVLRNASWSVDADRTHLVAAVTLNDREVRLVATPANSEHLPLTGNALVNLAVVP